MIFTKSQNDKSLELLDQFKENALVTKRRMFFSELSYTDWSVLIQKDEKTTLELLKALENTDIENSDEIFSILSSYKGLDGAYAELYSVIVTKIFLNNEKMTTKLLSQLPEDNIEVITTFIKYGCSYYSPGEALKDTEILLKSSDITDNEKLILINIKSE